MKKKLLISVLTFFLMGVMGCMSKEELNEKAIEKFNEKYNTTCEVKYTENINDSNEKRDEIHVYVPKYMDEGETAIIYSWEENGDAVSEDNFFGYIIREDYEKSLSEILSTEFDEVKVYVDFGTSALNDSLTEKSSLSDAYETGEKMISHAYIVVRTDLSETDFVNATDIISKLEKTNNLNVTNIFYALSNDDDFAQITRSNIQDKVDLFAKDSVYDMPFDAVNVCSW